MASAAASSTSALSFHPSGSAAGGDTLLLAVMLTNTHSGGVSASDSEGNAYRVVVDQTDGAGDRTLLFAAPAIRALSGADTVGLSFPTAGEYHVALDAFSGVSTIDGHSSGTGPAGSSFDSGAASLSGRGIVYGVAGVQGGDNASWTSGLNALPTLFVSEDQLATGYLVTPSSGSYRAGGNCQHQWMAGIVTLS